VLSTLFDIGVGAVYAAWLVHRRQSRLVHGRASVGGAVAMLAAQLSRRRFFYDADGDLAQEYVDVGAWREGSVAERLTRAGQDYCFRKADSVAVLTDVRRSQLDHLPHRDISVVPCAVDARLFRPKPESRVRTREALGLKGLTYVYLGKPGGWYDVESALRLVAATKQLQPDTQLLVITRETPELFLQLAEREKLAPVIRAASREEVPTLLAAGDVGLSVLARFPSKRQCSPVKNAEYLACGLPLVISPGSGDYDNIVEPREVGIALRPAEYENFGLAARRLLRLLDDPELPERCRRVAVEHAGLHETVLPTYRGIYEKLLGSPAPSS